MQLPAVNLLKKTFLGPKSALRYVPAILAAENENFLHTLDYVILVLFVEGLVKALSEFVYM